MTEIKESHTTSSHLETMPEVESLSLGFDDPKSSENTDSDHPQVKPKSLARG